MNLPFCFGPKIEKKPFFSASSGWVSSLDFSMMTGAGVIPATGGFSLAGGLIGGVWEGLVTGLLLGVGFGVGLGMGFGAVLEGAFLGGGEVGRFGGSGVFFAVGGVVFFEVEGFPAVEAGVFLDSKNARFLAASDSAAPKEGRRKAMATNARMGRVETKNRESTGGSSAGRVPSSQ